jgi:hypothetical protein
VDIIQKFLCQNITREEKYTTWLDSEEEKKRRRIKWYLANSMFVENDFIGRHNGVGSNLVAILKEDAEDTASENGGTNFLLQTKNLINIAKRQCIITVPKEVNSFVCKVAEPAIHFLRITYQHPSKADTQQQTNTARITGLLYITSLLSLL